MYNHTSSAQFYELLWGHWQISSNNWGGTLSVFLTEKYKYI